MSDYDLKTAVSKVGNKRVNFALYKGEKGNQMLITPKPASAKMIAAMEEEIGKAKRLAKGICYFKDDSFVFSTKSAAPPSCETTVTKLFKENQCAKFLPVAFQQMGEEESDEVSSEEEDAAPGASAKAPEVPAAPPLPEQKSTEAVPPPPPVPEVSGNAAEEKALWEKAKAGVLPPVKQALASNPESKATLAPLITKMLGLEKSGDFAGAASAAEEVQTALNAMTSSAPPAVPPVPPVPPASPVPPTAPAAGKIEELRAALTKVAPRIKDAIAANPASKDDLLRSAAAVQAAVKSGDAVQGMAALRTLVSALQTAASPAPAPVAPPPPPATGSKPPAKALPLWQAAKEASGAQIEALQGALRQAGHPLFTRIADQGLNAITKRLQVGLHVALIELDGAPPETKAAAAAKARKAVAEFRTFVDSDRSLQMLDENPFGIAVSLRSTLGGALSEIEAAIPA